MEISDLQGDVVQIMRTSIVGAFADNGFSDWENLPVRMYIEDALDQEYSLRLVTQHAQGACEVVLNRPRGCPATVWPPELHHLVSALAHANHAKEGEVNVA